VPEGSSSPLRREIVEAYIKRLNDLEQLAMAYPGVTKTYAIQAVIFTCPGYVISSCIFFAISPERFSVCLSSILSAPGARPGARREIVEAYIKRLNDLEQLAMAYPGVTKT